MNARLYRRLMSLGYQAGRRSEAGNIRFVALLSASLVLTITVLSMVSINALYTGKDIRTVERTTAVDESTPAQLLWAPTFDSLSTGRQFGVIFVDPLSPEAPVPPGVASWPDPGEVLMSPALLEEGDAEGIAHRYGTVVGTIGQDGLADPGEKLAYVHPLQDFNIDDPLRVVGFGPDAGELHYSIDLGVDNDRPEWSFQALIAGLLLIPSLALLAVAIRTASHHRDHRSTLIAALGARQRDHVALRVGECLTPVTIGVVLAALAVLPAFFYDVTLPVTDYLISSHDLRGAWPQLTVAVLLTWTTIIAAVAGFDRTRQTKTGTRPRASRSRLTLFLAWLFPVMLLIAVRGPHLFGAAGDAPRPAYILTYWVGAIGTAVTCPAAIAILVALTGRALAQRGRRRRNPGQLVAGRRLAVFPGPTARVVGGITIGLFVLLQALAWQGAFAAQANRAEKLIDDIGYGTLLVTPHGDVDAAAVARFGAELPARSQFLVLSREYDTDEVTTTLSGTCTTLAAIGVNCGADGGNVDPVSLPPALQVAVYGVSPQIRVTSDPAALAAATDDATIVAIVPNGEKSLLSTVKDSAYRIFPLGAQVDPPGASGLLGGTPNRDQALWTVLIGVTAVAVAALAAAFAGAAEYLRHGRAAAPLIALTGDFRVFKGHAVWSVFLPVALAAAAGTAVGALVAKPVDDVGSQLITMTLLVSCIVAVTVLGAVVTAAAAVITIREAKKWVPHGD